MSYVQPLGHSGLPCLSDLSIKDKPWDTHRANADIISRLYAEIGYDRYSERTSECSQWLQFALQETFETGVMSLKLYSARFCRVRFCPVCQWRRSFMWRARFLKAMPAILEAHPTARYLFLTLTIKNCPVEELRETIKLMNGAWQKLTQRKQFPATGFVRSLEVTRNSKEGSAHPHFHCLLMVRSSYFKKGYLSQETWTKLWQDCLKVDYTPIVNVKAIKPRKEGIDVNNVDSLVPALCETLKYSVKEDDLIADKGWLKEITKQMYKVKSISVGGIFREYLSEDEPEDLIHPSEDSEDLKDTPKLVFDWSAIIKKYTKRSD